MNTTEIKVAQELVASFSVFPIIVNTIHLWTVIVTAPRWIGCAVDPAGSSLKRWFASSRLIPHWVLGAACANRIRFAQRHLRPAPSAKCLDAVGSWMSRRVHANLSWRKGGRGQGQEGVAEGEEEAASCRQAGCVARIELVFAGHDWLIATARKKCRERENKRKRNRDRGKGETEGKAKHCSLNPLVVCGQPQLNPTTPATIANNCL